MEGYAEQGARTDSTDQIGFGGARRNRKKRRGLTVFQLKVIGAVALALSAGSTTENTRMTFCITGPKYLPVISAMEAPSLRSLIMPEK